MRCIRIIVRSQCIIGLRISTLACRPAADAATAKRPPTMAYAVCDFVRNSTWEVEMEHQVRAGPARELDARSRAIHAAADGLGKTAEAYPESTPKSYIFRFSSFI